MKFAGQGIQKLAYNLDRTHNQAFCSCDLVLEPMTLKDELDAARNVKSIRIYKQHHKYILKIFCTISYACV